MSHEPLPIDNRLIHEVFDYISLVFCIRHYPRIPIPTPAPKQSTDRATALEITGSKAPKTVFQWTPLRSIVLGQLTFHRERLSGIICYRYFSKGASKRLQKYQRTKQVRKASQNRVILWFPSFSQIAPTISSFTKSMDSN